MKEFRENDNCAISYSIPAIPSTIRLSLVSVPVLSKQQISTLPANGILNGSVQNTPTKRYQAYNCNYKIESL